MSNYGSYFACLRRYWLPRFHEHLHGIIIPVKSWICLSGPSVSLLEQRWKALLWIGGRHSYTPEISLWDNFSWSHEVGQASNILTDTHTPERASSRPQGHHTAPSMHQHVSAASRQQPSCCTAGGLPLICILLGQNSNKHSTLYCLTA